MKSRKFKRKAKKKPVINKELCTYDVTVSLPPELYESAKEDAAFFDVELSLCLNLLVHNAINELRSLADEKRKIHPGKFVYPDDCKGCSEGSIFDLNTQ